MDDHLNNLYQADFYRWLHQRIRKALKKMPGLRASLDASIAEAYEDAVDFAAFETGFAQIGVSSRASLRDDTDSG